MSSYVRTCTSMYELVRTSSSSYIPARSSCTRSYTMYELVSTSSYIDVRAFTYELVRMSSYISVRFYFCPFVHQRSLLECRCTFDIYRPIIVQIEKLKKCHTHTEASIHWHSQPIGAYRHTALKGLNMQTKEIKISNNLS